jgi:hypothetical protein
MISPVICANGDTSSSAGTSPETMAGGTLRGAETLLSKSKREGQMKTVVVAVFASFYIVTGV